MNSQKGAPLHFNSIFGNAEYHDKVTAWARLRIIGNTAAAKASIFLPALPYLLDTLDRTIGLKVDASSSALHMKLIYIGLCFIASASIIFYFGCPSIIKRYPADTDFVANELKYLTHIRRRYFEAHADKKGWLGDVLNPHPEDLLFAIYSGKNISRKAARQICATMYLVGTIFLLIPFAIKLFKSLTDVGQILISAF